MRKLSSSQELFFNTLHEIQEEVVQTALSKCSCENAERLLYDVTYETIYSIMELIDGYTKDNLQLDIIEKESKKSLKENIQLHDVCVDFIKS
ncbi:hypothetical protein AB1L07_08200 [Niallia alba]|uniref:Uncharacterized protein n=1 Tax=Niallia circulans TaxID=1397 RepID=A0A941JM99_NIACI|nr:MULTISPECIES: hypothetical protein [Niallia]MCB5237925.1 hypothetical protein [Niallia circulans]MED3794131.1 hypothetical protein [Niallia alba]